MNKLFDKRTIMPNLKVVLIPFLVLVSSIVFLIVVITNFYPKVSSTLSEIDKSKKNSQILEEKLRILREFQISAKESTDKSVLALPIKNPGTLPLAYIRKISQDYGVEITNVSFEKSASQKKDDWQEMNLKITFLSPDIASLSSFLSDVDKIVPIVSIDSVDIKSGDEGLVTDSSLSMYWSDTPLQIPSVGSSLKDLTSKEQEILSYVNNLRYFQTTSLQPNLYEGRRDNPFK